MIVHTCEACGFPVADGTGFVRVSFADIRQAQREQRDSSPVVAVSMTELLNRTMPKWHTQHQQCDPQRGDDSYCIDVEQLRTWEHLVWWFCQLSGKGWYQLTNWPEVAERMSKQLAGQALGEGA
jgi:hypothetical protein